MSRTIETKELTEEQFASQVDQISTTCDRTARLLALLDEANAVYSERSAAEVVRMRGWVLIALAGPTPSASPLPNTTRTIELGLHQTALIYVLEELDTGTDAYLVAAAARVLRCYALPQSHFASYLVRAISNVRYRDEQVSFNSYGDYAVGIQSTSAVGEILESLRWLGPHALSVLPELQALHNERLGLASKSRTQLKAIVDALEAAHTQLTTKASSAHQDCCEVPLAVQGIWNWAKHLRSKSIELDEILFEDQDGNTAGFDQIFVGRPSIVVFFYTRCDNPLKCSLTINKLASAQQLLNAQGLATKIQTVAITYDPEFDLPERLKRYGLDRGLVSDTWNRMLRTEQGFDALKSHFRLGVNFIDAIVNRHRIEVFVLDQQGKIASSFLRLHWDVQAVIDAAATQLKTPNDLNESATNPSVKKPMNFSSFAFSTSASLAIAFFPKCPFCWAAYLSAFGVAGLDQIPYSPWLVPLLVCMMMVNLVCLWFRARATKRLPAFCIAAIGLTLLFAGRIVLSWNELALGGVALSIFGVLWCALPAARR